MLGSQLFLCIYIYEKMLEENANYHSVNIPTKTKFKLHTFVSLNVKLGTDIYVHIYMCVFMGLGSRTHVKVGAAQSCLYQRYKAREPPCLSPLKKNV